MSCRIDVLIDATAYHPIVGGPVDYPSAFMHTYFPMYIRKHILIHIYIHAHIDTHKHT